MILVFIGCLWAVSGISAYLYLCKRFQSAVEFFEILGASMMGPVMIPVAIVVVRISKKWGII